MPELTDMQTIVTDMQTIVDTAQEAVEPKLIPTDDGVKRLYSVIVPNGADHVIVDVEQRLTPYLARPRRKTGRVGFTDPASLVGYLAKHKMPETEAFADADAGTITAVINAHEGYAEGDEPSDSPAYSGLAGWGDHTATLTLRATDDWTHWTENDGKWFSQTEFAEFIEQHLPCCVSPDGATMLELAQTFKATKAVKFEQSKRLKSGETKLEYREDIEAKAGSRGSLDIPDEIALALAPFERGEAYRVTARLRYRIINDGLLALSYVLIRPRDVLLDAFGQSAAAIADESGVEIWHGESR